ncbi:MAG: tetratricopeptide repeat protein [Nitrospirae bacterium]|nr:tetratricopeptide repeat protein [Nitrospirota bacterium]
MTHLSGTEFDYIIYIREEDNMLKGLLKGLEDSMVATAFAEAGEFETAREIMREEIPLSKKIKELRRDVALTIDDLTSMAITFAEAGEHEKALKILKEAEQRLEEIKLGHQKDLKGIVFTPKTSAI